MCPNGIRERSFDHKVVFPPYYNSGIQSGGKTVIWKGKQHTASEGHRRSRNGKYYEGGNFFSYLIKADVPSTKISFDWTKYGYPIKYSGPIVCANVPINYGSNNPVAQFPSSDSSYLDPIGAEAISIVDPLNPNAQTGVALGEIIKDRKIPTPGIQAWRQRTEIAKAAGSEYLNAVFGWLPLVSDMKDTAQSVLDGNTIIENYRAASGTLVHREFEFPSSNSTTETVIDSSTIGEMGFNVVGSFRAPVPVTRLSSTHTRRWFSGTFTYHANEGNSLAKCVGIGSEAEKLFGISLTPDLVWELTPWSWAIDWFSNAGNVISNVNSFAAAGLVMKYGYIMEETSTVDTYSMPSTGLTLVGGTLPSASITTTVKRRSEANPFGFGLSWDGLSPTQLAITAALGITRLR